MLADILTGAGTGRLNRSLEDTQKALSVDADVNELHDPGLMVLSATLNDQQSLDEVKAVIFDVLAGLATAPPTAEEVDRARPVSFRGSTARWPTRDVWRCD